jgi:MarR family
MPDTIDRARALIQARLSELEAEATKLQSALASMGEGSRRRQSRVGRATSSGSQGSASGRAKRGQRREQLLAAIKANPGARPADLARTMGVSANQVHGLIKKARAEKLVVKRGRGYALKA